MSVTVCISVFNRRNFIYRAIESVRNQTVLPTQLIVVDDGSEIPYQRLTLEGNPTEEVIRITHRGPANAWNAALMRAKGTWFVPLADDDWLSETFIEEALAQSRGADAVCVSVQESGRSFNLIRPKLMTEEEVWESNQYPYCALYRTKILKSVGGWHGMLPAFCDWGMWLDLIQRGAKISLAPDAILNYEIHENSHSYSLSRSDRKEEFAKLKEFFGC